MTKPEKRDESWMRALVKSRVERVSAGSGAMQASTIGFVLVGCIAAGFFLGSWLDTRYKTSFWMPALTIFGVFAGFFQLLQMLKQIDAAGKREDLEAKRDRAANAPKSRNVKSRAVKTVETQAVEESHSRSRIFAVPPPPTASFEESDETQIEATPLRDDEDERTLTERLLEDDSAKPQ